MTDYNNEYQPFTVIEDGVKTIYEPMDSEGNDFFIPFKNEEELNTLINLMGLLSFSKYKWDGSIKEGWLEVITLGMYSVHKELDENHEKYGMLFTYEQGIVTLNANVKWLENMKTQQEIV